MRLTKDGSRFPTEIMAKITRYENRLSSIGICRDITDRVKMEQRVREAERMAYVGQITTSLSHEIRNPLSAVNMNLQILKKNPQLHGNDRRRIDISAREVVRLERILKELLDFAKPLQVEMLPSQINQILSACVELLEMRLKEGNLFAITAFDSALPETMADGEKLGQAFINLLLNAIEASPCEGKIVVKSRYDQSGKAPWAGVFVQDQGPGVPRENMDEIFKPFFTTKTKGTGLGLANVKRIVDAHGGRVEVKNSRPGGGAAFRVWLPIKAEYGQNPSN
jgi:signal transduction histidine kinase